MAIALRAVSALVTSATTPTPVGTGGQLTPALPTGHVAGDLLLMHVAHASASAMSAPSGWALAANVTIGGTHTMHLMWKWDGGSESIPTFTGSTTGMWGALSAWSGVGVKADPFNIAPATATGSGISMTGASMTSTVANCVAIWFFTQSDNGVQGAASGQTGITVAYNGAGYDSTTGIDSSQGACYLTKTTAGATGAIAMASASGTGNGCIRVMLDPTVVASGPTRLFTQF